MACPIVVGSRCLGAGLQDDPGGRADQPDGPMPALTISATTISVAIASARQNPVSRMIPPATAVAMNANRSLRMCWKAPSALRLVRLARLIIQDAAILTTMPTSAVISTRVPVTSGGWISRRMAS